MDELTELVLAARDGDRLALGTFIRRTQADVWRTCRHLGPWAMADDLTQDTYVRMMRALPGFRGESTARTWLLSIARNVSIDALRSAKRRERLDLLFVSDADQQPLTGSSELDQVVAMLDADQRSAFVLTQVIGLSYIEAAEATGCPVGTIRSRVARARGRLVEWLEDESSEPGRRKA